MMHPITATQLRAARALLGLDQRALADLAGLSHPTVQRMEASDGSIKGNIESLIKLISALEAAGVELLGDGAPSSGVGRGVRFRARGMLADAGDGNPKSSTINRR